MARRKPNAKPSAISRKAADPKNRPEDGHVQYVAHSNARAAVLHRGEHYRDRPKARRVGVHRLRAPLPQGRLRERESVVGAKMPKEKKLQPPQHQDRQPGREYKMKPRPKAVDDRTDFASEWWDHRKRLTDFFIEGGNSMAKRWMHACANEAANPPAQ